MTVQEPINNISPSIELTENLKQDVVYYTTHEILAKELPLEVNLVLQACCSGVKNIYN